MLELKRLVVLLSVLLLTFSAPMPQFDPNVSENQEVASRAITGAPHIPGSGSVEIAAKGFGHPNEISQRDIRLGLQEEDAPMSLELLNFPLSKPNLSTEEGSHEGSKGHNGTHAVAEDSKESFKELTSAGDENSIESDLKEHDMDKVLDVIDDIHPNQPGQIPPTSSSSEESLSGQSEDSTELIISTKKSGLHQVLTTSLSTEDQSDSLEPSRVSHPLHDQSAGLRSLPDSNPSLFDNEKLSSEEGTSSESNNTEHDFKFEILFGRHQESGPTSGPQTASPVTHSSKVVNKEFLNYHPINISPEPTKSKSVPPGEIFSGMDLYPAYVNDEDVDFGQYDFGYYDPYGYQHGYAGYDPRYYDPYYNHHSYDPYNYDPNNYDPNNYDPNNYDPYNYDPRVYDPNYDPRNYDPDNYDPNNYDPRTYDPNNYDPRNYDPDNYNPSSYHPDNSISSHDYDKTSHVDPYYESKSHNQVEENGPPSSEAPDLTTGPTSQDSQSEEQPETTSASPLALPATSVSPSNSSSDENSEELSLRPSANSDELFHVAASTSQETEDPDSEAVGDSSSEESRETSLNSEQQNPVDHTENDSANQNSSFSTINQDKQDIQEVPVPSEMRDNEQPRSPSPELVSPSSSEEESAEEVVADTPTQRPAVDGGSSEEGAAGTKNPDTTPAGNNLSESNQGEESNELTSDTPESNQEVNTEPTLDHDLATEHPTLSPEPTDPVSNEDESMEINTPDPSVAPEPVSPDSSANANTADDSEESQENLASPTVPPKKPSAIRYVENSSEENIRKSSRRTISQSLAQPPKKTPTNPWMTFLQSLKAHLNQSVLGHQSTSRYRHSNRRQKNLSSEER